MLFAQPSPALGEQLATKLRLQIISGEIVIGQKLSENILASQFGLSRAPVREALKTLESEGLVSLTKQGVVVHGITEKDLQQLYEVRFLLEFTCMKHLRGLLTPEIADQLEMIVDRMDLALSHKDFEEFSDQDIRFHNKAFEMVDHKFLNLFWEKIKDLYQTLLYVGTKRRFEQGDYAYKQEVVSKHRLIVAALRSGNEEDIENALKGHFTRTTWIDNGSR